MIHIDVTPYPAPRQVQSDKWRPRPPVLRYRAYRDELRLKAKLQGITLNHCVKVCFYIPMPESWSQKKRDEMRRKPHQQKPDIDNLAKGFLDALLPDDAHVWYLAAWKVWNDVGGIDLEV